jgi:hypothetical protein
MQAKVMTLKLALLLAVLGAVTVSARAQRVEVYGGAQFSHLEPSFNGAGWDASLTGNFKHVLGITADFSGAYNRGVHAHTYTFGPVLTARLPIVQPFVHALFGGINVSDGGSSANGFAMFVGGGLDAGLRKGIGIRLVQVDWLSTHNSGVTFNRNVRASAGIVLKF